MAFKYRLESVLNLRRNLEEQVQHKLAHEIFVLENHRKYFEELYNGRKAHIMAIEEKKKGVLSASMYSFYMDSLRNYDRQIEFQISAIKVQERMVEEVRIELEDKVKERRIVERMKEKDYINYVKEEARKEQNEHDEMAVLRFGQVR